jgi:glutamate dehydrogenase
MIRDLAVEHQVEESNVVKAWGQSWSALNLAPVFSALDANALNVPRMVSIMVDARTRLLFKSVIEGVLSVPADRHCDAGAMEELTGLFAQPAVMKQLMPSKSNADAYPSLPAAFVQAWRSVDAIEAVASFLFAAISVQRPAGMTLAEFLGIGMALRGQAGIDTLERGLKLAPHSKSQEQLRNYAMRALRRTQQRLLMKVLAHSVDGRDTIGAVEAVTQEMGLTNNAPTRDLEHAILAAWTFSELSAKAPPPEVLVRRPRLANLLPLQ